MEFSRQEYWNGLSFPSPGNLPDPGIEPGSPALQAVSLEIAPPGKLRISTCVLLLEPLNSPFSSVQFSSVQFSHSVVSDSLWPHELQHARPPGPSPAPGVYPNPCPSSRWCHPAISCCRPLLLLHPIPPSIRVFSNESTLRMRWPKYWSFSFSISLSKEHPGLISFRMDWLDLLAVQGTLKSLLQHHSSKASIFLCSAFFTVHLAHLHMPLEKP